MFSKQIHFEDDFNSSVRKPVGEDKTRTVKVSKLKNFRSDIRVSTNTVSQEVGDIETTLIMSFHLDIIIFSRSS